MTWEEAFAYADSVLEAECAQQGITVEITDPQIIATSVALLRTGKRNHHTLRIETRPTATSR